MQSIDVLLEPLRALLAQAGAFFPGLLVAVAILLAGWRSTRYCCSSC